MGIRSFVVGSFIACTLVAAPASLEAAPGPGVAIAQQLGKSKKELENCFKTALKQLKAELKLIKADLKAGTITQAQAQILLAQAAATFSNHIDSHVLFVMTNFLTKANELLQTTGGTFPMGFLAGDCGAFDKLQAAIAAKAQSFLMKAQKDVWSLAKTIGNGAQVKITVNVQIAITLPPVQAPGNPNVEPKKLKITSASSAHDAAIANDGKLSIRGLAPTPGGTATVTARGPNGEIITQMVPVGADCSFEAHFPSAPGQAPAGNLAEGNWRVDVTAGGQTVTKFHGV